MNRLHIYAQGEWHGEAFILGNKEGLIALRDAIDHALATQTGSTASFTNDGEGYYTGVARIDKPEDFDRLALPYTDEVAADTSESIWPWQITKVINAVQAQYDKEFTKNPPNPPPQEIEGEESVEIFAPKDKQFDI